MKFTNLRLLPIALLAICLVIGYALPGYAAHSGGTIYLKDAAGNLLTAGTSTTPYSPKQTCAAAGCHVAYGQTAIYENTIATATKDHGPGTPSYNVPYPEHGVSAGYHFQQGKNISWNSDNDNAQRSFYGLAKFTSSPGMYGKY